MSNSKEGDWWTAPTDAAETGRLVMVTGRRDIDKFRENPRFKYRVDVTWPYEKPDATPDTPEVTEATEATEATDTKVQPGGMPSGEVAELLEQATDALKAEFARDPSAGVMTGIYTGDGRRDWVFYVPSLHIFQRKLNQALAPLPPMPLAFHAEEDPDWEEYTQMRSNSELTAPDEPSDR